MSRYARDIMSKMQVREMNTEPKCCDEWQVIIHVCDCAATCVIYHKLFVNRHIVRRTTLRIPKQWEIVIISQ